MAEGGRALRVADEMSRSGININTLELGARKQCARAPDRRPTRPTMIMKKGAKRTTKRARLLGARFLALVSSSFFLVLAAAAAVAARTLTNEMIFHAAGRPA